MSICSYCSIFATNYYQTAKLFLQDAIDHLNEMIIDRNLEKQQIISYLQRADVCNQLESYIYRWPSPKRITCMFRSRQQIIYLHVSLLLDNKQWISINFWPLDPLIQIHIETRIIKTNSEKIE